MANDYLLLALNELIKTNSGNFDLDKPRILTFSLYFSYKNKDWDIFIRKFLTINLT